MSNTLVVKAGPGTGKTSTIEAGINKVFCGVDPEYKPSEQQLAIWNWMNEHCPKDDVLCVAFNKSIATELESRLSFGTACTIHSLGAKLMFPYLRKVTGRAPKMDTWKTANIFCELVDVKTTRALSPDQKDLLDDVKRCVSICKDFTVVPDDLTEDRMAELNFLRDFTPQYDAKVLHKYVKTVMKTGLEDDGRLATYDFDDMIYVPNLYSLSKSYSTIMVDEAQDLSHGRRTLILNQQCDTYVVVGDTNQAVYAFAGADSESLNTISEMTEADELPLSISYRCSKAIVNEAQKYLTEGELHSRKGAPKGKVRSDSYDNMMEDLCPGDLLLCRINAPIISIAWKLIKEQKPAKIVGRNLAANLKSIVKKLLRKDSPSLPVFLQRASDWYDKQSAILDAKQSNTEDAEIRLADQYECITLLAGEADSVSELPKAIDLIFNQKKDEDCIRLSSIHRAKGLESDRVFWYAPENTPHVMAKTDVAKAQERNLQFVATTRAKSELVHVAKRKVKAV